MMISSILSFEFPPINELLRWRDVVPGLNKVGLIAIASALIGTLIFLSAARKDPKVAPKGTRNLAEVIVEFIENNIIMQTMGRDGLGWTPFLLTLFLFVYLCNVPGIIPFIQMPAALAWPMSMKRYNWGYLSEPEPNLNNRRITAPRGKVIGGSSSINGMVYIRGHALDYDGWAMRPGLTDWSYAHCLPYFKKMESFHRNFTIKFYKIISLTLRNLKKVSETIYSFSKCEMGFKNLHLFHQII